MINDEISLEMELPTFKTAKSIVKPKNTSEKLMTIDGILTNKPKSCNVMGMITEYSSIGKTPQGSWKRFLTLSDPTGQIQVVQFDNDPKRLINPDFYGQIVTLMDIDFKVYGGKPQLSYYVAGKSSKAQDFHLYPLDSQDETIADISEWSKNLLMTQTVKKSYHKDLGQLTRENLNKTAHDHICKILKIWKTPNEWRVQIADGSVSQVFGSVLEVMIPPLSNLAGLQMEVEKLSKVVGNENVFVKWRDAFHIDSFNNLVPMQYSSMYRLPEYSLDVVNMKKLLQEMESSSSTKQTDTLEMTTVPKMTFETKIPYHRAPIHKIEEIVKFEMQTWKFVTNAMVVKYFPDKKRFSIEICSVCKNTVKTKCSTCKDSKNEFVRCCKLMIKDETGDLLVYLYEDEFDKFFDIQNEIDVENAKFVLNSLIEQKIVFKFCLKSYIVNKRRCYQVFDTMLVQE